MWLDQRIIIDHHTCQFIFHFIQPFCIWKPAPIWMKIAGALGYRLIVIAHMTKRFALWFVISVIASLKVSQWQPSTSTKKKAHICTCPCSHQQFFKKICSFWFNEGRHETLLKHHKKQPQGNMNTSIHAHTHTNAFKFFPSLSSCSWCHS